MEFQEVAKQYSRMCEGNKYCINCPLHSLRMSMQTSRDCSRLWYEQPSMFESVVTQWATEHPEPVYPTWRQWMESTFPNARLDDLPCPTCFDKDYPCCSKCSQCENQQIPEHLATKLGIQKITPEINIDKITVDKSITDRAKIDMSQLNTTSTPKHGNITTEVKNDSCDCLH